MVASLFQRHAIIKICPIGQKIQTSLRRISFLILKTVSTPIMKSEIKNDNAPMKEAETKLKLQEQMVMKLIPMTNVYMLKISKVVLLGEVLALLVQITETVNKVSIKIQAKIAPRLKNAFSLFWMRVKQADAQAKCANMKSPAPAYKNELGLFFKGIEFNAISPPNEKSIAKKQIVLSMLF